MRTTTKFRSPSRRILIGAAALGLLVTGCGGDDDDGNATGSTTTTTATDRAPSTSEPSPEALCSAAVEVDKLFGALGPEASEDDTVAAAQQAAELLDLEVPADIADSVTVLRDGATAAAGGDAAAFETPEFTTASTELGNWVFGECGFEPVDVTATDYHFDGLPSEAGAGVFAFRLTNEGEEPHVLVITRKKDGVTESIEELLQQEDPSGSFDDVAAGAFAAPGDSGVVTAELPPGEYVVVCPIPIGTPVDGPPPEGAAPHFTAGMVHTFTVG